MNLNADWNEFIAEINAKIKQVPSYLHGEIVKDEAWASVHPVLNSLISCAIGAAFVALLWAL